MAEQQKDTRVRVRSFETQADQALLPQRKLRWGKGHSIMPEVVIVQPAEIEDSPSTRAQDETVRPEDVRAWYEHQAERTLAQVNDGTVRRMVQTGDIGTAALVAPITSYVRNIADKISK